MLATSHIDTEGSVERVQKLVHKLVSLVPKNFADDYFDSYCVDAKRGVKPSLVVMDSLF